MTEEGIIMKKTLELPVELGTIVYESHYPQDQKRVIGYRIGRLMGEFEEEFEEYYDPGQLYMVLEGCGISGSFPASRFGKSIFLTSVEATRAAGKLK